jgi:hypothetical protein
VSGFGQDAFGELPFGEQPPSSDTTPPVVYNWQPFFGRVIGRLDTIEFDVTDDVGVETVLVTALFATSDLETVWSNSGFSEVYRRGSVRTPIPGGYHFVLRRTRGWLGPEVLIDVVATDLAGNVGRGQAS